MNDDKITSKILYQFLILKALIYMGGSAERGGVLSRIRLVYGKFLSKKDLEDYDSGNGERWKNHLSFERQHLIYNGCLSKNSPHGIWEITDIGRHKFAEWRELLKQSLSEGEKLQE